MKNITRHTGKVEHLRRVDTSRNGNPRYEFIIDGYRVYTGVDSMHGYSIQNHEGKEITVTIGYHRNKLTLNTIEKA